MLQFWKRSVRDKIGPTSQASNVENENESLTLTNFENCVLSQLEDEGLYDINDSDAHPKHSRLSKNLSEVLTDKNALGYFIQFLDSQDGLSYIRCYLDIESFKTAAQRSTIDPDQHQTDQCIPSITREQLECTDLHLLSPLPSSRIDHDSLSVSTDCESYTADSTSLCDYNDIADTSYRLQKLDLNKKKEKTKVLTDDSLRIFKRYIAQEAPNSIHCTEDLRNDIIENICTQDGNIDYNCYNKIQKYVYDILEERYFNNYLRSHFNCKFQIDVLTSGNIILQDLLYNETILFYFMEFLEQDNCCNLLEFWMAASNFQTQLVSNTNVNLKQTQNDAIVLYDKYFSLQATCPLGFSDKIRFLIEENICKENGPEFNCFLQPIRIIENFLDKNYLKPFLSSQLYFKYLTELISTVQTNGYSSQISKPHKTNSDCSSEISNTLLAMDDTNFPKRKSLKPPKSDMNIDTRQLYDPDSLWRRKRTRRLSFGRITHFGRFETDVEPEPDKKSENRIAKVMRRLINMEEAKTKEEMAWKVAEMIVKDITNVTLAHDCVES